MSKSLKREVSILFLLGNLVSEEGYFFSRKKNTQYFLEQTKVCFCQVVNLWSPTKKSPSIDLECFQIKKKLSDVFTSSSKLMLQKLVKTY